MLQSVESHRRNVRARGHRKVRVGFSAFDIKIALLIEGQSAWATGIRGTQLLQRGVPAGGAGVVAVEGTGEIPGHTAGNQKRNGQSQRYRERVRKREQRQEKQLQRLRG